MIEKKNENEAVLTEFKLLEGSNDVYKLVGPILAKQEIGDCTNNVEKRIEWISKEIARLETLEADFQGKVTSKTALIKKMQADFQGIVQQAQQAQAQAEAKAGQ